MLEISYINLKSMLILSSYFFRNYEHFLMNFSEYTRVVSRNAAFQYFFKDKDHSW